MTRIGLSLVIAALLLHAPATRAAQLDKDSCAKLKTEQGQLEQGGTRGSMVRGPEWAKSNLAPDKLEVIRRLIEVDEQLLFRCGGRPLVLLPNGDPDPAAREIESPKGPPAKAAKPPQAVKKAPDAEKKKVATVEQGVRAARRSWLQGSSAGECGAISCGCSGRDPCQGSRPGGACPPTGDRRGDPSVEHNAAAGSRPGRVVSAATVQGGRGQEGGGHQGGQGQGGQEEGRRRQGRELGLVLQSLFQSGTAGQEVTDHRTALAEGPPRV